MPEPAEPTSMSTDSPTAVAAVEQSALIPPVDQYNQQWRTDRMLLCNWGGFEGVHELELDEVSTLISGATGAGKSTVLDAYTTLMYPSRPLNTASNETGARSRAEGIRTTLTYVRGVYDEVEQSDGSMKPLMLRGIGEDTWSAIAVVFASTTGARATLLRLFYAPRDASKPSEAQARFAVFDGAVTGRHIREQIEPLAAKSFRKDLIEKAIPGLRILPLGDYVAYTLQHLNIGSHEEGGRNALRLLHDLQAGTPVDSVDGLFKHMVLDKPGTYATADSVIASFDHLDKMHQEMKTKEDQIRTLASIETHRASLAAAQDELDRIDTLRLTEPDRSPFLLWALTRKDGLFDAKAEALKAEKHAAAETKSKLEAAAKGFASTIAEKQRLWRELGGGDIDNLDLDIESLRQRLGQVRSARSTYEHVTREVGLPAPRTVEDFAAAQSHARSFLASYATSEAELKETVRTKTFEHGELKKRHGGLLQETEELRERHGNILIDRHRARLAFAKAAGLAPTDLPFAGELIDMADEFGDWRTAADAVLGSLGNTLLVDERDRRKLRDAIDSISERTRIEYRGVDTGLPQPSPADQSTLAGRLMVKADTPFTGWLQNHLNNEFAYECVERAEDLGEDGIPRVTRNGQTQRGTRGAHGGHERRIIGFSNEERRRELEQEAADLVPDIKALEDELATLGDQQRKLILQQEGCEHVVRTRWDDIDADGLQDLIDQKETDRARLMESEDRLQTLRDDITDLEGDLTAAQQRIGGADKSISDCEIALGKLGATIDEHRSRLWPMEDDDSITVTGEQQEFLDKTLAASPWDGSLERFDEYVRLDDGRLVGHIPSQLVSTQGTARAKVETAATKLTSAFKEFNKEWPDASPGVTLASYEDHLALLTDLRTQGLGDQRATWVRQVIEWGGEDLMTLHNAYDKAHHEIDERLEPIRAILAKIPFTSSTTLDIAPSTRTPSAVKAFKSTLRSLASGSMNPNMPIEQVEAKFQAIRKAIARVRHDSDERDLLLDVRRHLRVTARELDEDHIRRRSFDSLRGKSGGQIQTLTAFIVGAALRFHLGDEERDRPRFMPVVLDEAFIKADVRHAARGVAAWRTLGFQLIVGAPEGQFSALEEAMGLIVGVTKDSEERSYITHLPRKTRSLQA